MIWRHSGRFDWQYDYQMCSRPHEVYGMKDVRCLLNRDNASKRHLRCGPLRIVSTLCRTDRLWVAALPLTKVPRAQIRHIDGTMYGTIHKARCRRLRVRSINETFARMEWTVENLRDSEQCSPYAEGDKSEYARHKQNCQEC